MTRTQFVEFVSLTCFTHSAGTQECVRGTQSSTTSHPGNAQGRADTRVGVRATQSTSRV